MLTVVPNPASRKGCRKVNSLHPPIEPYDHGMLDVGDGNRIYWEVCGNPDGKPALVVHGGPGSGCGTVARRRFDPDRYKVVLFDQRQCGRSTPHAADPSTDLTSNTTGHLVADMELLRRHLDIERWLLFGGSWGSTLILAYAQRHPDRVSEIVIPAVTTTRRSEIDWLYRGARLFFPEEWRRFRDAVPEAGRDATLPDVLAAYAERMADLDPAVRAEAAHEWCRWEDTVLSMETPSDAEKPFSDRPDAARHALVRIAAHYFSNGAWLEEGALIREAGRLANIPAVLIHGRFDMGGPLATAWELARAWPGARLVVVEDAGHLGSDAMSAEIRTALDEFASR
ncbi:prolyl aminopeptidase [Streptomyces marispadix]|uniref:Proline iminopeptidase n=1 Tax=Streptomyces marispadix TaxID=2922868 RepID=A0ABS9SWT3_9ACTN|nr:prolyl aminopeptidase [Streptomyces marispadix]MCH6160722.1 prolyl aminopeptidase [Streptomyces marispadix]